MQRVVANLQGLFVDVSQYEKKREILCQGLAEAGYRFTKPSGGFYLFCPTPVEDDIAFVQALAKELILVVPGRGFAGPGHMRIAFCVEDAVIQKAIPGFKRVLEQFIR
jgi:aspartate aminotransferase